MGPAGKFFVEVQPIAAATAIVAITPRVNRVRNIRVKLSQSGSAIRDPERLASSPRGRYSLHVSNYLLERHVMVSGTPETRRSIMRSLAGLAAAGFSGLFGRARAAEQAATSQPASDKPPLFAGSVTHNGLVYVAGKGEHGPGDIKEHTTSVLNQIEAELKKAGSSMEKVLKVNVYLHDIRDYDGMNEAYRGCARSATSRCASPAASARPPVAARPSG
jgi:enamine deaminase RidA (YjgF/YER057c/UK114 family)